MAAEAVANLIFTGPLGWTERSVLQRAELGCSSRPPASVPRPAPSAKRNARSVCRSCAVLARVPRLGARAPRVRLLGWRVRRRARRRRLPRRHARRPRRPLPPRRRPTRRPPRLPHRVTLRRALAAYAPHVALAASAHRSLPGVNDTPEGVDLDRLQPLVRRQRRGCDRCTAARVADLGRTLEPHLLRRRRQPTSGCCAVRRSATCCPPRTTWPASTRCSRALAPHRRAGAAHARVLRRHRR